MGWDYYHWLSRPSVVVPHRSRSRIGADTASMTFFCQVKYLDLLVYALLRQDMSSQKPSDGVRKFASELLMRAVQFSFSLRLDKEPFDRNGKEENFLSRK
jgi:hypothetical protein